MTKPSHSPIFRRLLKLPGQDADDDLQDFVADHLIAPMIALGVIGSICMTEWIHYWSHSPPDPWIYSAWFIGTVLVVVVHWRRQWQVAMAKRLGRDGERAVAEYLHLRVADTRVFHCVPLGRGVADHVMICKKGIFAIETKTRTLPRRGKAVVHVSDSGLRVGGYYPDRDPLRQVERYRTTLQRRLRRVEKARDHVFGIVVYPGWQVLDERVTQTKVAVLNASDLDGHLTAHPDILTADEVTSIGRRIARSLRLNTSPSQRPVPIVERAR